MRPRSDRYVATEPITLQHASARGGGLTENVKDVVQALQTNLVAWREGEAWANGKGARKEEEEEGERGVGAK